MPLPANVQAFLGGRRIAVAGVSRDPGQPANAIFRKLKRHGYAVFAVNPGADILEGERCYPSLAAVPPPLDGVVVVTPPGASAAVAREAAALGVKHVWFHRSFGDGSVSPDALAACRAAGVDPVEGGCPMMYLEPDVAHRCMRWMLKLSNRVPG